MILDLKKLKLRLVNEKLQNVDRKKNKRNFIISNPEGNHAICAGLTENIDRSGYRWHVIDKLISPLKLEQFMVEADDQDVLSKYIEIFGPGINMMVDHDRLLKKEDARIGYGPSQFLWGKVVKY